MYGLHRKGLTPQKRLGQQFGATRVGLLLLPGIIFAFFPACAAKKGPPGSYLFCFWNVENLYDDQDDPKNDDEIENWFAANPELYRIKVDRLADALLTLNEGIGPDIVALCEVENQSCLDALEQRLNERLNQIGRADQGYRHVLFRGDNTGRRFAPGILTRLPVRANRTNKPGNRYNGRILEGHLEVNGFELIVIAAHWTSRVSDSDGSRRMSYAQDCYGRFRAILTDSADADVILCGDFNDEFSDASLQQGLKATDDPRVANAATREPRPLALLAGWGASNDPPGSIYGRGKWSVFDHICFSRGMLDQSGWSGVPKSAEVVAPKLLRKQLARGRYEPFEFGGIGERGPRGYSDHFPVTVRLNVQGNDK